jgi:hypothetical protein
MSQKPKSHRLKLVRQRCREGRASRETLPVKPCDGTCGRCQACQDDLFFARVCAQVECEGEDQEAVQ